MNKFFAPITAIALAATFSLATVAPASADQAAVTRNTIFGAVALVAGIAIEANVQKHAAAARYDNRHDRYQNDQQNYRNANNNNNYNNDNNYNNGGGRWSGRLGR